MGCGPCGSSNAVVFPQPISISVEQKLRNLISQYKKIDQGSIHPILTFDECSLVEQELASAQKLHPPQCNNTSPADGSNLHLLTPIEKIVWKCFILIPSYDPNNLSSLDAYLSNSVEQKCPGSFYQISLDINRTFPTHKHLDRSSLENVLKNIASCYPGLGYTQGMNFYAGFLLLCGFEERQTFYLLVSLFTSRQYLLAHNFQHQFKQTQVASSVLLDHIDPQVRQTLEQNNIFDQLYSFQWFLCCFLVTFKLEESVQVWDQMIKTGDSTKPIDQDTGGICFIASLAVQIMKQLSQEILQSSNPEGVMNVLRPANIQKKFTSKELANILQGLKNRVPQNNSRNLLTKKLFLEKDPKLRLVLTTKQHYEKYIMALRGITDERK